MIQRLTNQMCVCAQSCLTLLRPYELLCAWDFPGKNTGVGRSSLAVLTTHGLHGHSSPVSGTALTPLLHFQPGTWCLAQMLITLSSHTYSNHSDCRVSSPLSELQGDQCPKSRLRSCAVTSCSSLLLLPVCHSANIR